MLPAAQALAAAASKRRVMSWRRVHLCTGILERAGHILLVANRYPNLTQTLWNLPGGRQESPETLADAVRREFLEETTLAVNVLTLAYVAESYDRATATHFTNFTFNVSATGDPHVPPGDAHAVGCEWVLLEALAQRLTVAVVRDPLIGHLADTQRRYFGYAEAGISIEFADESG